MSEVVQLETDPTIGVTRIEGATLSREQAIGHLAQIFPLVNAAINEDSARFNYEYRGRVPLDVNLPEKVDRWLPRIQASGPLMETGLSFYGAYRLDTDGQPRTAPTDMFGLLILRRGDNEELSDTEVLAHNMYIYPRDPANEATSLRSKGLARLMMQEAIATVPPEFSVRADVAPGRTDVLDWLSRLGFSVAQEIAPKDPDDPAAGFEELMLKVPAATLHQRLGIS